MITTKQNFNLTENADGLQQFCSNAPFIFNQDGSICPLVLAFETYGELSPQKDNVILVHHALSTSSHLSSHAKNPAPGWWEEVVGPGKPIDTKRFFVICINNIGSCFGSSSPVSVNPQTDKTYQRDFPSITIEDIARSQQILLSRLGIKKLYAVVGNSMGAMISLTYAILFPDAVERLISVSSSYKSYPMSIATHAIQKEIIELDPDWQNGHYTKPPLRGFNAARKFGLISYRNPAELSARFEKEGDLREYLDYNAKKFTALFDANCFLYILEAMDLFDVTKNYADKLAPFREITAKTLVVSVSSDLLFPPMQQRALYELLHQAGVAAQYVQHDSDYGHDAFYADKTISRHIKKFLKDD